MGNPSNDTSNLSNAVNVLKNFYLLGVQRVVNDQTPLFQHFLQGKKRKWNGEKIDKRYSIGDNLSAAWLAEAGNLPASQKQTYLNLLLRAKYVYSPFEITAQAIHNANGQNPGAFLDLMDDEMEGCKRGLQKKLERGTLFGGPLKGFFTPTGNASGNTSGIMLASNASLFSAPVAMPFDGDIQFFADRGVVAATVSTWVRVQLYNTEDWSELVPTPNVDAATAGIWVTDYSIANQTISVRCGIDDASNHAKIDYTLVNSPFCVAVKIAPTALMDTTSPTPLQIGQDLSAYNSTDDGVTRAYGQEMTGIFGNLGDPMFWNNSRNTYAQFRPTVVTAGSVGTTLASRGAMSRSVIDKTWARVMEAAGLDDGEFSHMWLHSTQLMKYKALGLDGTGPVTHMTTGVGEGGRTVDIGAKVRTFMQKPIQLSSYMPKGAIFLEQHSTWECLPQKDISFADLDGNVLSRHGTKADVYDGYARWWGNLACWDPRQNAIIVGATIV